MNIKVEKKDKSQVVIEFTISNEEFNKRLDESFKKNANYFKVPGFRNGKVPRAIVEKTYGEGILYQSAIEETVDADYMKAVKENNLEVVSKPELDIVQIGKDKECIYTVTVYVKPEVKLKKYKGLEVKKETVKVTKEDVLKELESVQEKNARIVTVEDRPLKEKDISNIDFEGFLEGVAFEGGKGDNFELTIGSGQFIPGFEEQLVGMKIGEEREIKTTFPKEYHSENLAGKETTFKVKLNSIKEKELAKLDDEFAKDVSEFETLEDYKNDIKENLTKQKEKQLEIQKETEIIEKLIENFETEIPESMVDSQVEENLEQFNANISSQGFTLEAYAGMLNTDIEGLKEQFKPNALRDVKLKLALEYIIKEEKVEVTAEEINEKIEELIKQYGSENGESMKKNPNVIHYMNEKLRQEKALDIVKNSAIEK